MSTAIQSALADLQEQRGATERQLGKLDEAIAALERVLGTAVVPTDRPTDRPRISQQEAERPQTRRADPDDAGPKNGDLAAKCLQAVSSLGPSGTGPISVKVRAPQETVRATLQALEVKGMVHVTGTGPRNRRWCLGAKGSKSAPPAKEEVRGRP